MSISAKTMGLATAAVIVTALIAAPIARHHLGGAEAQTRPATGIDPKIVRPTTIGMNLGTPTYYTSEEAFADPFKSHAQPNLESGNTIKNEQLKHDDQGNLIDVPMGAKFSVRLKDGLAPIVPGTYHCQISPGWKVENLLNAPVSQSGTNFTITLAKQAATTVAMYLTTTKDGAALTTLSCRYPGASGDAIFRKEFLDEMRPYKVLRFMDWMVTNNEPKRTWATRPTPQSIDQITNGVALEYMVALANELHADPWFTLPYDADETYYRNFALYVRDHLAPGLKAYVELSNEVWNGSFSQSKDATTQGKSRYPGVSDDKANDYYYADRVRDFMTIWTDVFKGQQKRIVRVLASQLWDQRGDQRLGHRETYKLVDALAIAPYWGDVPNDAPGSGKTRIDYMIAKAPTYIDQALAEGRANKIVAAKYGLPLITYEGGPGFWAFNPEMMKDVEAASKDPRMYDLYQGFLKRWQKEIGGPLVLYQSAVATPFGHRQYTGQPVSDSPKARAVEDFIRQLPPSP